MKSNKTVVFQIRRAKFKVGLNLASPASFMPFGDEEMGNCLCASRSVGQTAPHAEIHSVWEEQGGSTEKSHLCPRRQSAPHLMGMETGLTMPTTLGDHRCVPGLTLPSISFLNP